MRAGLRDYDDRTSDRTRLRRAEAAAGADRERRAAAGHRDLHRGGAHAAGAGGIRPDVADGAGDRREGRARTTACGWGTSRAACRSKSTRRRRRTAKKRSGRRLEGDVEKITIRIPAELKDLAQQAASKAGTSANTWFIKALARAVRNIDVQTAPPPPPRFREARGAPRHAAQRAERLGGRRRRRIAQAPTDGRASDGRHDDRRGRNMTFDELIGGETAWQHRATPDTAARPGEWRAARRPRRIARRSLAAAWCAQAAWLDRGARSSARRTARRTERAAVGGVAMRTHGTNNDERMEVVEQAIWRDRDRRRACARRSRRATRDDVADERDGFRADDRRVRGGAARGVSERAAAVDGLRMRRARARQRAAGADGPTLARRREGRGYGHAALCIHPGTVAAGGIGRPDARMADRARRA